MKVISDDDVYAILSPRTSREEREAAFMRAVAEVWQAGWDACAEEFAIGLAAMNDTTTGSPH